MLLVSSVAGFSQDNSKSLAIKKNKRPENYPLIRPIAPSYTLMAGYILRKKAQEGDPFAEHELGIRYLLGRGFPPDTAKAVYWIEKAVKSNIPAINFNYGIMLNNGIGVDWNPFEAFKNFQKAAVSNMPAAQFMLGLFYLDNLVVNKNLIEAYKWFSESSKNGYKEADKILKELSKNSKIKFDKDSLVTQNNRKAKENTTAQVITKPGEFELEYLSFATDTIKSGTETKNVLDTVLKQKPGEIVKQLGISDSNFYAKDTQAIDLINSAARFGSPEALYLSGVLKENKNTEESNLLALFDYLQAYRLGSFKATAGIYRLLNNIFLKPYLQKQIQNANPLAMYVLAALIAYDFDVSVPKAEALKLLIKAADKNYVPAIIELGLLYKNGSMVPKDIVKAKNYFERAKKLGSKEAEIRLALLEISDLHKPDVSNEIKTLETYAGKGSVLAQTSLAFCYEKGLGVKKNKAKAAKLYRIAASRGNRTAYAALKNMYDEIRPSDKIFQILN